MKNIVIGALLAVAAVAALVIRPPGMMGRAAPAAALSPPVPALARSGAAGAPAEAAGAPPIVVYVAGAVRRPGVYRVPAGARADDALRRSGGALPDADLVAVNLAARLSDGDELAIPHRGGPAETPVAAAAAAHGHRHGKRHRRSRRRDSPAGVDAPPATSQIAAPLDLNTADVAALQTLPGIGPGLAERIVRYRADNGPFRSIDELADVAGITPRLQSEFENAAVVR